MAVRYEWVRETVDAETGDILDVDHADRAEDVWPVAANERLALVRDTGDDVAGLQDRMWAYVDNNMLPAEFSYSEDEGPNGVRVPQRFHREIARAAG